MENSNSEPPSKLIKYFNPEPKPVKLFRLYSPNYIGTLFNSNQVWEVIGVKFDGEYSANPRYTIRLVAEFGNPTPEFGRIEEFNQSVFVDLFDEFIPERKSLKPQY